MDIEGANGFSLRGLGKINVILGKNGCGKSTLLRGIEQASSSIATFGKVTYITPERSGTLIFQSHIEQEVMSAAGSLNNNRRANQYVSFKQTSVAQYRKLSALISNETEAYLHDELPDRPETMRAYLERLNLLLDQVEVVRRDSLFAIVKKGESSQEIAPDRISSGESELISLGIEALVFEKEAVSGKINLFLLDEPDVQLTPGPAGPPNGLRLEAGRERCLSSGHRDT